MLHLIHGADLHLDSPFSHLPPEQAALRRRAQRQLPWEIAALCRACDCELLLLAGDIFDAAHPAPETVRALRDALAECGAEVFLAPGNHDPYTDRSVWATELWPENVHIFTGGWEVFDLPYCRIFGAAFRSERAEHLLQPVVPDGRLAIGVLHGDPETPGDYNSITRQQLASCGLDYLALGHIHRRAMPRQAGRTWYGWPGAAMGRGFDETGPCGVLHVSLDKGVCDAEFLPLPGLRYEKYIIKAGDNPEAAVRAIMLDDPQNVICRITLTGQAASFNPDVLTRRLAPSFAAFELRDETTPATGLWDGLDAGDLRGLTLQHLNAQYDDADEAQRKTLTLAARYVLAALEGGDPPCEL